MNWQLPTGAQTEEEGVRFRVWAPDVQTLDVVILGPGDEAKARYPLVKDSEGYFSGHLKAVGADSRYMYRLDGEKMRPDPASRYQPDGVHGPSLVIDPSFDWTDGDWKGIPLRELTLYEVHIGTATPAGTFEAFIEKLPYLKSLGITAIELMPIADFPGDRNWGYDGVDLFAPARAYGGPWGLKKLVDAAHRVGLAIVLDVVYNHLGPDGNYLRDFSKAYFTGDKKTPWGDAINYGNRHVREYFISNAIYWAQEYHMDGLRLDATHAILDENEEHLLAEIARRVRETLPEGRHFAIFAEDERNDAALVRPLSEGGVGLDALWADDFHHQIRSALAGDNEGYYADYTGSAADLAETLNRGWFYVGQRSRNAGKPRGTDPAGVPPERFVYCIQNHDQIGNRALGDRLNHDISPEAYRAASALLLLGPYTPLLFQGQEWATSTPFLFFTDHNPELGKLITEGRRAEFAYFASFSGEQVPDPQAESTFQASKLKWEEAEKGQHAATLKLYRELLRLRRELPALRTREHDSFEAEQVGENAIALRYTTPSSEDDLLLVVNLGGDVRLALDDKDVTRAPDGRRWELVLSTNEPRYRGNEPVGETFLSGGVTILAEKPVAILSKVAK